VGFSGQFQFSLYQSIALGKLYKFGIKFAKIGPKFWPQIEPKVGAIADYDRTIARIESN
jgi:hypothetical protein